MTPKGSHYLTFLFLPLAGCIFFHLSQIFAEFVVVYFPGGTRSNSRQAKNSPTSSYYTQSLTHVCIKVLAVSVRSRSRWEMSEGRDSHADWEKNEYTMRCPVAPSSVYVGYLFMWLLHSVECEVMKKKRVKLVQRERAYFFSEFLFWNKAA